MTKPTEYAGIDYGLGKTNRDPQTGIAYGVIAENSLQCDAASELSCGSHSTDLGFEAFKEEMEAKIKSTLKEALDDYLADRHIDKVVNAAVEEAGNWIGDNYNNNDRTQYRYDDGKYVIESCLDSDCIVLKSPFYTHAQYCSPCVPGAGNLESPCDSGVKCYCLGHDWFESGEAPYPVFSVETEKRVVMVETKLGCPNCMGSGKDSVVRLADVRGCTLKEVVDSIEKGDTHVTEFVKDTGLFQCFRCGGAGHTIEKTEIEVNE